MSSQIDRKSPKDQIKTEQIENLKDVLCEQFDQMQEARLQNLMNERSRPVKQKRNSVQSYTTLHPDVLKILKMSIERQVEVSFDKRNTMDIERLTSQYKSIQQPALNNFDHLPQFTEENEQVFIESMKTIQDVEPTKLIKDDKTPTRSRYNSVPKRTRVLIQYDDCNTNQTKKTNDLRMSVQILPLIDQPHVKTTVADYKKDAHKYVRNSIKNRTTQISGLLSQRDTFWTNIKNKSISMADDLNVRESIARKFTTPGKKKSGTPFDLGDAQENIKLRLGKSIKTKYSKIVNNRRSTLQPASKVQNDSDDEMPTFD